MASKSEVIVLYDPSPDKKIGVTEDVVVKIGSGSTIKIEALGNGSATFKVSDDKINFKPRFLVSLVDSNVAMNGDITSEGDYMTTIMDSNYFKCEGCTGFTKIIASVMD